MDALPMIAERKWAWYAKEALAYWRHRETGSVGSHTASQVLEDQRERDVQLPHWVEELANMVLDYERLTGDSVHDGKGGA